jgi:hypothetical protein
MMWVGPSEEGPPDVDFEIGGVDQTQLRFDEESISVGEPLLDASNETGPELGVGLETDPLREVPEIDVDTEVDLIGIQGHAHPRAPATEPGFIGTLGQGEGRHT